MINVWNDRAQRGHLRSQNHNRPWYRYAAVLLQRVQNDARLPALDVGCGVGEFMRTLTQMGFEAQGVDGNSEQISRVRDAGFRATVADLENELPFEDESFALVTCLEVIEHIARAEFFLSELYRILRPAGYLLLSTPNFAFFNNRLHYLLGMAPYNEGVHLRYFTKSRLDGAIKHAGFNLMARNSYGVLPFISTISSRMPKVGPILWQVPNYLESLLAYDLILLAQKPF